MAYQNLKSALSEVRKTAKKDVEYASLSYTGALRLNASHNVRNEIEVDFETLSLRYPAHYGKTKAKVSISIGQTVAKAMLSDPRLGNQPISTLRTVRVVRDEKFVVLHFLQEENK